MLRQCMWGNTVRVSHCCIWYDIISIFDRNCILAACVHASIVAEAVYGRPPGSVKCNAVTGDFEPVQCRDSTCWCVDTRSGDETPGTRAIFGTPNCDGELFTLHLYLLPPVSQQSPTHDNKCTLF